MTNEKIISVILFSSCFKTGKKITMMKHSVGPSNEYCRNQSLIYSMKWNVWNVLFWFCFWFFAIVVVNYLHDAHDFYSLLQKALIEFILRWLAPLNALLFFLLYALCYIVSVVIIKKGEHRRKKGGEKKKMEQKRVDDESMGRRKMRLVFRKHKGNAKT